MFILRSLKNTERVIQIGSDPIRIGRGADNTLIISDKSVSRKHATLQVESGAPVLTDLNSTRGTFVNGVQVRRQRLKPGDVISFGTAEWKLDEVIANRAVSPGADLVLSSLADPRRRYRLTQEQVHIGRGEENQLRITDKSVSREHALIRFENGKFFLLDKNSSSGTFVNNQRVQKAVLNPGDVIAFGQEKWRLQPVGGSQPAGQTGQAIGQAETRQFYVGNYSLHQDPIHGGVLQPAGAGTIQLQDRLPPVYVRPCHFGALVDRKREVSVASASGPSSPVLFYGPHGAGKSTLLCYLAHHSFAVTFPDGIVHLLARGRGWMDLLQNILAAFYEQPAGYVATEIQIRERLRSKNALILLDDVELDPEETTQLLAAAPGCTFLLASSHNCLAKGGRILELDGFESEDAVLLFGKVLGRALSVEEFPLVQLVCSVLRNNPARIVQAASHVRGLRLPMGGFASAINVAAPVDALNNLIVNSLADSERSVLAVLAALDGGSLHNRHLPPLVGIKDTNQVLEGLMGRGLVKELDNRYALSGTFAGYLQEKWDLSDWSFRLMEHFSSWVERHQKQPEYVLFEIEAILAILTWAVRASRWQEVLQFSRGVESVLMAGKQWGAWQKVLELSLQAAQMLGDRAAEAWALHQLGTRAICLGDSSTARTSLDRAYRIREALGDKVGAEITRQNQHLLSATLPVPAKPEAFAKPVAPAKSAIGALRTYFLFGGGIAALVTLALILFNWPSSPIPSTPVPAPTTRRGPEVISVISPLPSRTLTPSRTPTTRASPTRTRTSIPSRTRTLTPTRTRTSTPTSTRTVIPLPSFGSPQLSTDQVYYGDPGCGPNSVTISVQAEYPAGIRSVVFFRRLHEVGGGGDSGWSSIDSMRLTGGNTYSISITGDNLVAGTGFNSSAQVSYQFVIDPQSGEYVRSAVYQNLLLKPCRIVTMTYTPTPTLTPGTSEPLGSITGGAWEDYNGNGVRDSEDPGYSGLNVELRDNCGEFYAPLDSTLTNKNGRFTFDNLSPGKYCVVVPSGFCSNPVTLGWWENKKIPWFRFVDGFCEP